MWIAKAKCIFLTVLALKNIFISSFSLLIWRWRPNMELKKRNIGDSPETVFMSRYDLLIVFLFVWWDRYNVNPPCRERKKGVRLVSRYLTFRDVIFSTEFLNLWFVLCFLASDELLPHRPLLLLLHPSIALIHDDT